MSLSNVPATCIFPYAIDPRNWRDRHDLVEYCLCIGDKSIASNKKNKIRFDSKEMEIRLMAVVSKTTTSRTTISGGSIISNDLQKDVDASSELILSRRALAEEFLSSSSEENTPEVENCVGENGAQKSENEFISPLQKSWDSYKKNQNNDNTNENGKPSKKESHYSRTTSKIDMLNAEERHPLRQLNQQQQRQQTQSQSPKNGGQSQQPREDDEVEVVEPMTFDGVAHRKANLAHVNYVRLVSS